MIDRELEVEAMDTVDEAREYDLMDHATVNTRFVSDMLDAVARAGRSDLRGQFVVDVGTGTAQIPIEFCRVQPSGRKPAAERLRLRQPLPLLCRAKYSPSGRDRRQPSYSSTAACPGWALTRLSRNTRGSATSATIIISLKSLA